MYNRISFFVFSLLLCFGLHAQRNDYFLNLNRQNGLSDNFVKVITEDNYGFMWFGTVNGLNRFDGTRIDVFKAKSNAKKYLTGNNINDLLSTRDDKLLIANNNGVNSYNYRNENFTTIPLFNSQSVAKLLEDDNGSIWAVTSNGLVIKLKEDLTKDDNFSFTELIKKEFDVTTSSLRVFKYDKNHLMIYILDKGLYTFNLLSLKFNFVLKPFVRLEITKILKLSDKEFWVATKSGIYIYKNNKLFAHLNEGNSNKHLNNKLVHNIKKINNEIWAFTDGGGINVYDLKENRIRYIKEDELNEYSLASNFLYSSYVSRDSTLWVGSIKNGVSHLVKNNPFTTYKLTKLENKKLTKYPVSSIFIDSKNQLWAASDGNGLYKFSEDNFYNYCSDKRIKTISSINEIESERLLLGTYRNGVYELNVRNSQSAVQSDLQKKIYTSAKIVSISKTLNNNLLVSGYKTLEVNNNSGFLKFKEFVLRKIVLSTYVDRDKNIEIFGTANGVYKISDGKSELVTNEPKQVISIIKYKNDSYWLGTNNGICLLDLKTKSTKFYSDESGLNSTHIKSMINSDSNDLWVGTSLGISKFNVETKRFTNYSYRNGFSDNEFINPAVAKGNNGSLFFGGLTGVLSFHPEDIVNHNRIKKVVFTRIYINHKKSENNKEESSDYVANTNQLEVNHKQRVITIEYSNFEYDYPERIEYAYKLEGYDTNWQNTTDKSLTYMNLSPGEYELKVKASNSIGNWGKQYSSLNIVVIPAWWQTLWFKVLMIALFLLILYFSIDFILKREREKRNYEFQRKSLEDQKLMDEKQIRFFTNLSHELRTPLSLIVSPVRTILDDSSLDTNKRKNLSLIEKNALRIERLINRGIDLRKTQFKEPELQLEKIQIIGFIKDLANGFHGLSESMNIDLKIESNVETQFLWFDKYMLETIFYNLLSNAFKYSKKNNEVIINIQASKKEIKIEIKDNGIGISDEDLEHVFERFFQSKNHIGGSGIGLAITKRFVEANNGEISVESKLNEGSSFKLKLLLGDEHINKEFIKKDVKDVSNKKHVVNYNELKEDSIKTKPEIELKALANTILIVEDEADLRQYMYNDLSESYNVICASNGIEGLETLSKSKVDLVVSDVMMPLMDGFELCVKIKENIKTLDVPVILLTAKSLNQDIKKGYNVGADGYMQKPFDLQLLKARISNLLNKKTSIKNKFLESLNIDIKKDSAHNHSKLFLEKCLSIMEEHIENPDFNVSIFAREIGMSKSLVYKKLKEVSDIGISDLMLKLRMNKATQLLIHSNKSIAEISIFVGFKNTKYFSTAFKKKYKISPLKYRAEQQKINNKFDED